MVVITMLAMLPNYVNQRPRILFICVVSLFVDLAIIMTIDSYSYYHSANHAALLCQPACQVPKPSLLGRSSQVEAARQTSQPASQAEPQPGRASQPESRNPELEKFRNWEKSEKQQFQGSHFMSKVSMPPPSPIDRPISVRKWVSRRPISVRKWVDPSNFLQ